MTGEIECPENFGGEFLGLEAECEDVVCAGACCLPDKGCVETGQGACGQMLGIFQGRGSICGDDCPTLMPTSFTYQGQLKRAGVPLNEVIDGRFSLWLSPTGDDPANRIDPTLTQNSIEVSNGLFTVELNFGQNAFNGSARWLQVEIHDHADPPDTFTTLTPRQPLTPTPYALQTRGIVVTDNGNVGIGTKSPQELFHVNGAVRWGGTTTDFAYSGEDALGLFLEQKGSSSTKSKIRLQTSKSGDLNNYSRFFIDPNNGFSFMTLGTGNGKVGIGTTAPVSGLHVRHEPGVGGTLAIEGSTYTYLGFFPQGVAAGRKAWLGFGAPNTNELTLGNETGGDINLSTLGNVTAEDVVVTGKIDIGLERVFSFSGDFSHVFAGCPTGKTVISGSCVCSGGSLVFSSPVENGWYCECDFGVLGGGVFADAICARVK